MYTSMHTDHQAVCWGLMAASVGLFHTTPSREVTIGFMAKPIHNLSGT